MSFIEPPPWVEHACGQVTDMRRSGRNVHPSVAGMIRRIGRLLELDRLPAPEVEVRGTKFVRLSWAADNGRVARMCLCGKGVLVETNHPDGWGMVDDGLTPRWVPKARDILGWVYPVEGGGCLLDEDGKESTRR